jgi:hypothetical protein
MHELLYVLYIAKPSTVPVLTLGNPWTSDTRHEYVSDAQPTAHGGIEQGWQPQVRQEWRGWTSRGRQSVRGDERPDARLRGDVKD